MTLKRTKTGVRAPYTFDDLKQEILRQRNALDAKGKKTSYRVIARKYGVSHAAIHRIIVYGYEPKDPNIRSALGLPPERVSVEPLSCGHAPLRKSCPICNQKKYAPHPVMRLSKIRRILQSPYRDS